MISMPDRVHEESAPARLKGSTRRYVALGKHGGLRVLAAATPGGSVGEDRGVGYRSRSAL